MAAVGGGSRVSLLLICGYHGRDEGVGGDCGGQAFEAYSGPNATEMEAGEGSTCADAAGLVIKGGRLHTTLVLVCLERHALPVPSQGIHCCQRDGGMTQAK